MKLYAGKHQAYVATLAGGIFAFCTEAASAVFKQAAVNVADAQSSQVTGEKPTLVGMGCHVKPNWVWHMTDPIFASPAVNLESHTVIVVGVTGRVAALSFGGEGQTTTHQFWHQKHG